MSEQISLSFTILPDGNITACVSAIPFIEGSLASESQAARIVGSHNVSEDAEAKFVAAISEAISNFRTAKGI